MYMALDEVIRSTIGWQENVLITRNRIQNVTLKASSPDVVIELAKQITDMGLRLIRRRKQSRY